MNEEHEMVLALTRRLWEVVAALKAGETPEEALATEDDHAEQPVTKG